MVGKRREQGQEPFFFKIHFGHRVDGWVNCTDLLVYFGVSETKRGIVSCEHETSCECCGPWMEIVG